jgi:CRISPR-associated protein (TIGR03986 family)
VAVHQADQARLDALERFGGGANPYTFIPALPRDGLPSGLGDGPPAPHGVIDPTAQWSGWLTLHLVTRTPLLLPDPETASRDADDHPTYPVRQGPDGQPLLHGASVKGALKSAYETVTGSRYGVFRGHDRALAYRQPATKPDLVPARVESDGQGGLHFRLCAWPPLAVPLYDPRARPGQRGRRLAQATGTARTEINGKDGTPDWSKLHGREVWYTTRDAGKPGKTRRVVDEVTLATEPRPADAAGSGWLSVTGRSIENKASERLFVPTGVPPVPVEDRHHELWQAVLASYRDAAEYNEPGTDPAGRKLERSRHVPVDREIPSRLEEGDLVYLDVVRPAARHGANPGRRAAGPVTVAAVHPVIFGRLPYQRSPAQALDDSLHPAADLAELSPADRLFGWAPAAASGRRSSSGYRGRLRIEAVTCQTSDWLTDHGPAGVTLAPLSSPKPTQFRFYAASDENGAPVEQGAAKKDGYRSGLRGRKAYWYPSSAPDGYWKPSTAQVDGQFREWQAPPEAKRSQTATHQGWVREGAEFTVRVFLDAVPAPELGPLIWLASQDGCALRLGAGKPYGFGAVAVSIDWDNTELRTGEALRDCWLALHRPDPAPRADVEALAAGFDQIATEDTVLAPAITAWRKVAQGIDVPIHYPRTSKQPEPETYRWFVENERMRGQNARYGFALPHVLEDDQRLPLLPQDPGNT